MLKRNLSVGLLAWVCASAMCINIAYAKVLIKEIKVECDPKPGDASYHVVEAAPKISYTLITIGMEAQTPHKQGLITVWDDFEEAETRAGREKEDLIGHATAKCGESEGRDAEVDMINRYAGAIYDNYLVGREASGITNHIDSSGSSLQCAEGQSLTVYMRKPNCPNPNRKFYYRGLVIATKNDGSSAVINKSGLSEAEVEALKRKMASWAELQRKAIPLQEQREQPYLGRGLAEVERQLEIAQRANNGELIQLLNTQRTELTALIAQHRREAALPLTGNNEDPAIAAHRRDNIRYHTLRNQIQARNELATRQGRPTEDVEAVFHYFTFRHGAVAPGTTVATTAAAPQVLNNATAHHLTPPPVVMQGGSQNGCACNIM